MRYCSVDGCSQKHAAKGYCRKHYERWKKHGDPHHSATWYATPEECFEARTNKIDAEGCWEWTGYKNRGGYGVMRLGEKVGLAHRYAYERFVGAIPDTGNPHDNCILHKCDNPACVNPSHLFLGSQADNVVDMHSKGRAAQLVGEQTGNSKLSERIVKTIRGSKAPSSVLAEKFGVNSATINRIRSRVTWRHVA